MRLSEEEYFKLKETVEKAALRRKELRKRVKIPHTLKQRKMDHLNASEIKIIEELKLQMGSIIQKNTFITPSRKKTADTPTKKDMKKGRNNPGSYGIHSISHRKNVLKLSDQLIKHCVERHGIKELKHIKARMVEEFFKEKMVTGQWSPTTLRTKISQMEKIGESAAKCGIKHYSRLVNKPTKKLKETYKARKQDRTRGKKASGNGLTLREARVIAKHAGKQYGPLGRVMIDILAEAGPRAAELLKLKWEHFDFSNNRIDLLQKNINKGDRPRIIEDLSQKTLQKLQLIYESGLFPNPKQTIFRSQFHSLKGVRQVIENAAKSGKVANLAIHAFRNSTKEYQTKNFKKILAKYEKEHGKQIGRKLFKEFMGEKLMRYVSADPRLNPVVNQETGEKKFEYEKIITQRVDRIINEVVSQIFGHNRTDVLSRY